MAPRFHLPLTDQEQPGLAGTSGKVDAILDINRYFQEEESFFFEQEASSAAPGSSRCAATRP